MRQNRVHLMPPMSNFYARICVKATPSSNSRSLLLNGKDLPEEKSRAGRRSLCQSTGFLWRSFSLFLCAKSV